MQFMRFQWLNHHGTVCGNYTMLYKYRCIVSVCMIFWRVTFIFQLLGFLTGVVLYQVLLQGTMKMTWMLFESF